MICCHEEEHKPYPYLSGVRSKNIFNSSEILKIDRNNIQLGVNMLFHNFCIHFIYKLSDVIKCRQF